MLIYFANSTTGGVKYPIPDPGPAFDLSQYSILFGLAVIGTLALASAFFCNRCKEHCVPYDDDQEVEFTPLLAPDVI